MSPDLNRRRSLQKSLVLCRSLIHYKRGDTILSLLCLKIYKCILSSDRVITVLGCGYGKG